MSKITINKTDLFEPFNKLTLVKTRSKNFTSVKGRNTYNTCLSLMDKVRADWSLEYSKEVLDFLLENKTLLK